MDALLEGLKAWLSPAAWIAWIQAHPLIALAIAVPFAALIVWGLVKGGLGMRRAVVNVVGIGLVIWSSLWFADWVKPSLTSEDLFVPPVVGPQAVKAVFVEPKTIERTAEYTGVVHPYERIVVRARTDGFVEEIAAYPGDRITEGQLLVKLETSQLKPQLEKARAELRYLHAESKRHKDLFKSGVSSSSTLELARSKENVMQATVRLMGIELGYAMVRARSDGWVSRRAVDPGQYARKGDHLLAYERLAKVRVRFDVAVQDLVQIRLGTEVILEFPEIPAQRLATTALADRLAEGFAGAAIRAEITSIFPRADEQSRLGIVEVMIPNPELLLKSNMYVIGHFVTGRTENAWVVPERALTPMPGGKTVIFIAPAFSDQGQAEMREVRVGLRNGREVELLEGLAEPAFVVVAGNRNVTDGETVTVVAREGGLF